MTTNIKINGNDLSTLFASYTGGNKATNTNYKVNGQDISNIFEPYTIGIKQQNVNNIRINSGLYISDILKKKSDWSALGTSSLADASSNIGAIYINPSNGYIYVGGLFTTINGVSANNAAYWNGSTWNSLSTGLSGGTCTSILYINNTTIYFGGGFTTPNSRFALWNGTSWVNTGAGLYNLVNALEKDSNNNIYIGGIYTRLGGSGTNYTHNRICRFTSSSNTYSALPISAGTGATFNGLSASCLSLKYNSTNNTLYIGGSFVTCYNSNTSSVNCNYICSFNITSNTFSSLGTGVNGNVYAIEISNNILYAGGSFTNAGGVTVSNVAMYDIQTSTWSALGSGLNGTVNVLKMFNSYLFAGGSFTTNNSRTVNYISYYNFTTSTWEIIDTRINGIITELDIDSNGKIYAGGSFTSPYYGLAVYS